MFFKFSLILPIPLNEARIFWFFKFILILFIIFDKPRMFRFLKFILFLFILSSKLGCFILKNILHFSIVKHVSFYKVNLVLIKNEDFFVKISSYFFSCFKCIRRMSYVSKKKKFYSNF